LKSFVSYLGCGKVYPNNKSKTVLEFKIDNFNPIIEKIIPFFKKYPIIGVKALDFADFCKVAELIKDKAHLTKKGLEKIRLIKSVTNKGKQF
jgi:LAGLIDADG endonuclease